MTVVAEPEVSRGVGAQPPRGWLRELLAPLMILTKDGQVKRLDQVWNYAQLDFIDEVERQIVDTGQVRICTLKARQIGLSTIIEAILFTFCVMLDDFSALVMAHEKPASEWLLGMSTRYWTTYCDADKHKTKYMGRQHLAWADTGSQMVVKTAANENSGVSNTIHALHASEVGLWSEPETLMTGLRQSIPSFGLTFIFLESTARGVGNYFHRECMKSMKGENEFGFKFYPWWNHPEYTTAYISVEQREKYKIGANDLDDEEKWLRSVLKLSDARLVWRRWAIVNLCQGDIKKFDQEYPSTPHHAFVATGSNVFPLKEILSHYRPLKGKRGVLQRDKQSRKVEFVPRSDGWLTVYSYPSADKSWGVYIGGGDPTHTYAGDNAVIQVLNRRTLEQVAVYRNKIDPLRFGKHAELIGTWYNEALLAIEREGPGYGTVGVIHGDGYPNIFQATNVVSAQGKPADAYGWSTNSQTKGLAISHLLKHLTEPLVDVDGVTWGLVIHDELTVMEMRDYVTTDDGKKFTNSDGSEYDDGVMSLAIAVTVHDIEPDPPAYEAPDVHTGRVNIGVKTQPTTQPSPVESKPSDYDDGDGDDPDSDPIPPWELWSTNKER